ncbi:MAG: preprotein translocase subunit SecG [Methylococcales bacterium]|nr:preprotein translocase subunit SecG [Methylococcales bacterium]MDP3837568.1 preprotein translocase subunit SecG [Methylococcales bacterium]
MYQVIIVIHVLLGLGVIGLVLMQQGKGADAGAAFGTGSAGSVFGAQGAASFLSRSTAILATLFFATSLGLAIVNGHKDTERDLMATPAANESGLPAVDGAKIQDAMPPVAAPDTQQAPALPVPSVEQPVAVPVETPKAVDTTKPAENVKPAEEKAPAVDKKPAEAKKPVEHKPAAKDKKADAHKGKDAKKDH